MTNDELAALLKHGSAAHVIKALWTEHAEDCALIRRLNHATMRTLARLADAVIDDDCEAALRIAQAVVHQNRMAAQLTVDTVMAWTETVCRNLELLLDDAPPALGPDDQAEPDETA